MLLPQLFQYNDWANRKVIALAKQVTREQLTAPTNFGHHHLWGTLVHLLAAEVIWRSRLEGNSPPTLLREDEFSTWYELESRWHKENEALQRYIASLTAEQVNQTITYNTTKGVEHREKLEALLHHLLFHGMQHRAEIAVMLTQHGYPPGDIDYLVYLRE